MWLSHQRVMPWSWPRAVLSVPAARIVLIMGGYPHFVLLSWLSGEVTDRPEAVPADSDGSALQHA
jgi:hypothetical protein